MNGIAYCIAAALAVAGCGKDEPQAAAGVYVEIALKNTGEIHDPSRKKPIGGAKSLVIRPATTTHHRMDEAALLAAGITAGTVRLSIGLEDADDLIENLSRALYASQKA